jgi:prepilin-type N-terminal cleavage/methylation domain-containing protein
VSVPRSNPAGGFTLTELAIVMLIIGILLGSMLAFLSTQTLARETAETQRVLEQAREALIGFAIKNGRLPCPAAPAATGTESFTGPSNWTCSSPHDGYVPAITLSLSPTDAQGYLIDAWGNRVRYAVSAWIKTPPYVTASCPRGAPVVDYSKCPVFVTQNGMIGYGLANLPPSLSEPLTELRVCDNAACSSALDFRTPALVFSPGKNSPLQTAAGGPVGVDELQNVDGDAVFVMHEPRVAASPGGEFDDLILWIPPAILYNRLLSAGAF